MRPQGGGSRRAKVAAAGCNDSSGNLKACAGSRGVEIGSCGAMQLDQRITSWAQYNTSGPTTFYLCQVQ